MALASKQKPFRFDLQIDTVFVDTCQVDADSHAIAATIGIYGRLPNIQWAKDRELNSRELVHDLPQAPVQPLQLYASNILHRTFT